MTWAQNEETRAVQCYRSSGSGQPDPSNKDPNFTRRSCLRESPWTRNLQDIRGLFGEGQPCLHVDLHGCKDPASPGAGFHLIAGLRAMELADRADVEEFRAQLGGILPVILKGFDINMRPATMNTGACWDEGRCTLSQQGLADEGGGWSHAVQLEMSTSFRAELMGDAELRSCMAEGVLLAWQATLASGGQYLSPVVPPLRELQASVAALLQRAKAHHKRRSSGDIAR
mmetsp:Transcript_63997/g.180155  ORF Transcript_63997/g.180155 Transcript_63997/m.180155 type:complete len:228 (+) Transcript_63997:1-684(+)